jgi:hypothetical protein
MTAILNPIAVTENAVVKNGVALDRMECRGDRGGKIIVWRAASRRNHIMAGWHSTQAQASKNN